MYIANSKKQPLVNHLVEVGKNAKLIAERLNLYKDVGNGYFPLIAELSGLYHDVGKIDVEFQKYINNEVDYEPDDGEKANFALTYPLHHEWSLLLLIASWKKLKKQIQIRYPDLKGQSLKGIYKSIQYAVYWHHAEQQRDIPLNQLFNNAMNASSSLDVSVVEDFNNFFNQVVDFDIQIDSDDLEDALEKIKEIPFIDVSSVQINKKEQKNSITDSVISNSENLLLRYCTIAADRYVSSLNADSISQPINETVYDDRNLLRCIETYIAKEQFAGSRTESQKQVADYLAGYDSNTLVGPAGSGKTRVALMDYFYSRTKYQSNHHGIVWAVPRVVVGLGVLDEIRTECPEISVSIVSGEHKGIWRGDEALLNTHLFEADIVIMTIDQIAKRLTRHSVHDEFSVFLERFVVFDEYHELFAIQSLYWISLLLMRMKEWQCNAHRFVSATPEPFHLSLVAQSYYTFENPIVLKSFNEKAIEISMVNEYSAEDVAAIYVFNTATMAQRTAIKSFVKGGRALDCFHSKFTPKDRRELTQRILSRYGKNSEERSHTLYAGPIAQAALNISRKTLYTQASSPANLLQRVGRCNRFAEHDKGVFNIIVDKDTLSEKKGQYGYFGEIKNTGIKKQNIVNGKVISLFKSHYGELSYRFLRGLCQYHEIDGSKPLSSVSIKTNMNELMKFYLEFWKDFMSKPESKQIELFDYIFESAELLSNFNAFKPTKRIVADSTGAVEVIVSFRGDSKRATMLRVNYNETWELDEFTAAHSSEELVSVAEHDYLGIELKENLEHSPFPEQKKQYSTLKYRAQFLGMSVEQLLIVLASNPDTPLICSNPNKPNSTSLLYMTLNDLQNPLCLGFMRLENGLNDLLKLIDKKG